MKFGLALMNDFPPGTVPADRLAGLREQVRVAAKSGIDSVWVLQHYLGNMPTLQPVPLLSALAADAGDMYLGTNMLILPLRHPVGVAEEFATLDHISNGHAIAGFGMGYRENEFASFGIPMEQRVGRFDESVQIIRALWSGEPIAFAGEHFIIDDQRISLPPVQPGGPQIWIGAGPHKTGARRAARLGDAWIIPPHESAERLQVLLEYYRDERELLGLNSPNEFVVRRELVLDDDPERARATGVAARTALTRKYAEFNAPDQTSGYQHLKSDDAAEKTADSAYLFTDPAGAISALKELESGGFTYVILRMQWFDLAQDRMLHTLEMFRDHVLPAFSSSSSVGG